MQPNNPNNRRPTTPQVPQRPYLHSPGAHERTVSSQQHHEAAADIARSQLASIYGGNTHTPTPQTTPVAPEQEPSTHQIAEQQPLETTNPYERTHAQSTSVSTDQWKQYHSAWQTYYQKYYERYYVGQVHRAHQMIATRATEATQPIATTPQPQEQIEEQPASESMTRRQALTDLRKNLRSRIRQTAKKAHGSRHFVPITAALCVILVFLFLQYNRNIFATVNAYVSPGNIDPANIIVDPTTELKVSPDPRLIIPKINIDVPVVWNAKPDHDSQMAAMEKGVAWFGIPGANSKPGQVGNTVLSGHSSNDLLDQGSYKFIFAQLDRLDKGDTIYINYEGTRYTYTVTKEEVVLPNNVQALIYDTDKPILTLITCTPVGTAEKRLLITAEQISPNPNEAKAAPKESANDTAAMPGNSPTFFERLFGA